MGFYGVAIQQHVIFINGEVCTYLSSNFRFG